MDLLQLYLPPNQHRNVMRVLQSPRGTQGDWQVQAHVSRLCISFCQCARKCQGLEFWLMGVYCRSLTLINALFHVPSQRYSTRFACLKPHLGLGPSQFFSAGEDNRTLQRVHTEARRWELLTGQEAGTVRLGCSTGQVHRARRRVLPRHKSEGEMHRGPASHLPLKSRTAGTESSSFRLGCPSSPRSRGHCLPEDLFCTRLPVTAVPLATCTHVGAMPWQSPSHTHSVLAASYSRGFWPQRHRETT